MTAIPISSILALLVAIGLFASGSAAAQEYPDQVIQLVARTKAQIRTMDMEAFKSFLDGAGDRGLIVNVREPGEFVDGHIPGALNIPRGQIELKIWPYVGFPGNMDLGRRITLYCGSGMRCILAARSLQELGFSNVIAVDMKLANWAKAGYPLVSE